LLRPQFSREHIMDLEETERAMGIFFQAVGSPPAGAEGG
jgi:hypothetical protein